MTQLEQLIFDSVERAEAEEREAEALAEARNIEYQRLLLEATQARLAEIVGLPDALLPYCVAARGPGRFDCETDTDALKGRWRPEEFRIEAPNLGPIKFTIEPEWTDSAPRAQTGKFVTRRISAGDYEFSQWPPAIAEAARVHRRKIEQEQLGVRGESFVISAYVEPSPTERLVALIEEIVVNKVSELMEV